MMPNLITTSNTPTMSSREIADLVEARHNDVVATITRLFEKGLLRSSRKTRNQSTGGRPIEVYDLIERDTHLVVAGYSDEHRARVIDRWQELEEAVAAPAIPQSLPEALRLAADLAEQNSHLQLVVSEQAPKVEALNRIAVAEGSLCITDAAKSLQIKRKDLLKIMQKRKWIYRRTGSTHFVAYQDKIQSGVMEHKYATVERPDGTEKTTEQARITPKGLVRLADIIREVA